ncbi:MAG: aldose 1-epimerase [Chloroflexota bacterium]
MADYRYAVTVGEAPLGGYVLHDREAGSTARVLPGVGANCVQFSVRGPEGRAIQLLRAPASAAELRATPSRFGQPLLFPFPNRIARGCYRFQDQEYQLAVNNHGNAIHGLVLAAPFRVEAAEATNQGAHLRCVIAHADLEQSQGYPFPFRLVADYVLQGTVLSLTVSAINEGDSSMPFGFGIHPYFRAPMTDEGQQSDCQIAVPVGDRWELDAGLIPTGRRVPLTSKDPTDRLMPIGDRTFDDVYSAVTLVDGTSTCRLVDPAVRLEMALEADANFREIVVYAPPGQGVVCFEPYTCATDAFNLDEHGINAGRRVLERGEAWEATLRMVARHV